MAEQQTSAWDVQNILTEEQLQEVAFKEAQASVAAAAAVVKDFIPNPACYMAINNKVYGKPYQCKLRGNDSLGLPSNSIILDQREKSLKSKLSIQGVILRAMDAGSNPLHLKWFYYTIAITSSDINDFKIQHPGTFTLGPHFQAPVDWDSTTFGLITFSTRKIRSFHGVRPELRDVSEMFADLSRYHIDGSVIKFEVIVSMRSSNICLFNMEKRILSHKESDYTVDWFKNSPTVMQLRQNNIYSAADRPALSAPGLVLKLRRSLALINDLKIALVYCRSSAHTIETCRGIEKSYAIRILPKKRLNSFSGNETDCLVADTRWKCGFMYITSAESVEPATYGVKYSCELLKIEDVKHVESFRAFAEKLGFLSN